MNTNELKSIRLARGLTQTDLARLAGIHQSDVSRIETGQLDDSTKRERIEAALGVTSVEVPELVPLAALFQQKRKRWLHEKPEIPMEHRWQNARLTFGAAWVDDLLERIRMHTDGERSLKILESLILDSSLELVYLARLVEWGWRFQKARPLSLGCRLLIRDRRRNMYVGDVSRWVLVRKTGTHILVAIPQVTVAGAAVKATPSGTVRTAYRVDIVGLVGAGPFVAQFVIEVDGPHHKKQTRQDYERTLDLNLPTLRVTESDLMSDVMTQLMAFAVPLCTSKPKTVVHFS